MISLLVNVEWKIIRKIREFRISSFEHPDTSYVDIVKYRKKFDNLEFIMYSGEITLILKLWGRYST